jgi:hypothetical protein
VQIGVPKKVSVFEITPEMVTNLPQAMATRVHMEVNQKANPTHVTAGHAFACCLARMTLTRQCPVVVELSIYHHTPLVRALTHALVWPSTLYDGLNLSCSRPFVAHTPPPLPTVLNRVPVPDDAGVASAYAR